MNTPDGSLTNARLGYPAQARLLFINADDFGMCHSVNEAIIRSLNDGIVKSCSVMVPCPWALHALEWLREAPHIPFGIHLTVISEQPSYRWGPIACRSEVPTLVDKDGYFYAESRIEEFLDQVNLTELEREFRLQIERVLSANLRPSHLDSHCGIHTRREQIFKMTLDLAREYDVALRVYEQPFIAQLQHQGYPTNNHPLMDSYDVDIADKTERYLQMLHVLPVGLSEWAVHPGLGTNELQAAMPSWQVRQTDFDFVMSNEALEVIQQEGIVLVDYREIQALWSRRPLA
ncbi:hypothetical protein Deipe_2162 [Deinococcus peraridilitoris DSM 19664]|uniref:ChbG/HpnK family deacetylase n=2 Tax=Deinococcus TaxID=1298 RepID=L0A1F3_DEIPD|nr:hypothetical protein Deipe_2162 [Deinococcus peraridilitoris DSM 19664]